MTAPAPAKPTSRTIGLARLGLGAILLLSVVVLLALGMSIRGSELEAVCLVVGKLALSVSVIASGGAVGHSARHWGAKEPSGAVPHA